jgi:hypothetical protein
VKTTVSNLFRLSGLSALVAGILFVFVGPLHPAQDPAAVATSLWAIVHVMAFAVSFFGLLGMAGIYARQAEDAGWLGLVGFLMFSLWLVLAAGFVFFEALIFPLLATEAPAFTEGFLGMFTGSTGGTNVGVLAALWKLTGVLYMLGPLLFGVATLRAGILPRAPAALFGVGAASALAFALLPPAMEPLATVPVGAGLAWLGYALLSERREPASAPLPGRAAPRLRPTGAA